MHDIGKYPLFKTESFCQVSRFVYVYKYTHMKTYTKIMRCFTYIYILFESTFKFKILFLNYIVTTP